MKKFIDFKIVTCICTAASVLFLTFKLCGDSRVTWNMIIFPAMLSLAFWGLVWAIEFAVACIEYFWVNPWWHRFKLDQEYLPKNNHPIYWDSETKEFYSPEYGVMKFDNEEDTE